MEKIVQAYLIYLPITLALTLYVARTLFRNARVFMMDIFNGRAEIADSTNRLFEVGFYLLNMGFALWFLKIDQGEYQDHDQVTGEQITVYSRLLDTNQELVEILAGKLGGFAIYLGITLFLHLYMFFRGKRKASEMRRLRTVPVVAPTQH
jgi:predicted PurR-regulated permease PerM